MSVTESSCPFCAAVLAGRIIAVYGTVYAIYDLYPVTPGHCLIVPFRHTPDYFTLTDEERRDTEALILTLYANSRTTDPSICGVNIGMNCGETAGQTVPHAHCHLIPRRKGDTAIPRGGVRGVIPDKMQY